jgi:hypothetical protein
MKSLPSSAAKAGIENKPVIAALKRYATQIQVQTGVRAASFFNQESGP